MTKLPAKDQQQLLVNMYTNWLKNNRGICTEKEMLFVADLLASATIKLNNLKNKNNAN